MLDSDGQPVVFDNLYHISWQKWSGSVARYDFYCKSEQWEGDLVFIDQKSRQMFTEDYLKKVQAKIKLIK